MPSRTVQKSSGASRWSAWRCKAGCIHVDLGKLTLKLTPKELVALADLLADAVEQCHTDDEKDKLLVSETQGVH